MSRPTPEIAQGYAGGTQAWIASGRAVGVGL